MSDDDLPRFHGRRAGRRLRVGQKALLETLLPQISLTLPSGIAPSSPARFFSREYAAYWLEIGFGGGEHLAAQAAAYPDVGLIGAEPFINGMVSLLRQVERRQLANIRVLGDDVRPLLARLTPASLARVFILFPDPWPKTRHHNRRLINAANLDHLHRVLCAQGELRIASDHQGYVAWILRHVLDHGGFQWMAVRADDWRQRPEDWPATRYEDKARAKGDAPVFLRLQKKPLVTRA